MVSTPKYHSISYADLPEESKKRFMEDLDAACDGTKTMPMKDWDDYFICYWENFGVRAAYREYLKWRKEYRTGVAKEPETDDARRERLRKIVADAKRITDSAPPACANCRWQHAKTVNRCTNPITVAQCITLDKYNAGQMESCRNQRTDEGVCGKDGFLFEPRLSLFDHILSLIGMITKLLRRSK